MNAPVAPLHLLPTVNQRPVPPALIAALQARLGTRCSTALVVREQHGRDESSFDVPPPGAVVFAQSTDEVAFVVQLAAQHQVPIIPFGVGTPLEGHPLAVQGGIRLDVSQMNTVPSINAQEPCVPTHTPGARPPQALLRIHGPALNKLQPREAFPWVQSTSSGASAAPRGSITISSGRPPSRRRQLPGIGAYAQLSGPLDHASRNLRVLARRCAVALPQPRPTHPAQQLRCRRQMLPPTRLRSRERSRPRATPRKPSPARL